jgi:recombinational DNA repair protein (RecF pathway)
LTVQFLWRFLRHSGHQPEIEACAACGRRLEVDETAYMHADHSGFLCCGCAPSRHLPMTPGARRYLLHSSRLQPAQAARLGLDRQSLATLQKLLFELVQSALELQLNSVAYVKGLV